jgi:hypothetical protein
MKKLLISAILLTNNFAFSGFVPDSLDQEFCRHWWGTKDEQVLAALSRIYLSYKVNNLETADFYTSILKAIIHDEPLPD